MEKWSWAGITKAQLKGIERLGDVCRSNDFKAVNPAHLGRVIVWWSTSLIGLLFFMNRIWMKKD